MAVGPFDLIGTAASIGFSVAGGLMSYNAAKKENQIQQQEIGVEEQQNAVRRQGMKLMAERMQIENARKTQFALSQARQNATSQGAQFGSGLAGGLAQASGEGAWNAQGINQNLQLGEQMFNLTDQLDQLKIQYSQAQSKELEGNALSGIGGDISKNMNSISSVGGNLWGGGGDWTKGVWNMFGGAA